ncbi:MAG: hypothetical protein AB1733_21085 [Thermodesulfobacteriota bacterium]
MNASSEKVVRRFAKQGLSVVAVLAGAICCDLSGTTLPAYGEQAQATQESGAVLPGQSSATIGSSGYTVPIPEIKMNRIFGTGKSRPSPDPEKSKATDGLREEEPLQRAPIRDESKSGGPRKGPSPMGEPLQEQKDMGRPAQVEPEAPAPPSSSQYGPGPTKRGPESEMRTPAPGKEEQPAESRKSDVKQQAEPSPGDEGQQPDISEMIMRAPQAPEDARKPPPPPQKELLREKTSPETPTILKAIPSKEGPGALSIPRSEVDELADPREWIRLDQRREPEVIPPPELEPLPGDQGRDAGTPSILPEPERIIHRERPFPESSIGQPRPTDLKQEQKPEPVIAPPPEIVPQSRLEPKPEPSPTLQPYPGIEPRREPARESPFPMTPPVPTVSPESQPPRESTSGGEELKTPPAEPSKEEAITQEETPLPPKEMLRSPLEEEALNSPEVREYLQQASPILEELSLLMTTAPSLNLADYDPSDTSGPAIPRDVYLRMDAIKRQLQILDSKTFAIIPPRKYAAFHSLIRESIAETNQACSAIMSYLQDTKAEDLRAVREHLLRARKLIQRTRETTG